jgi:MoaA/NifB/PqqE/SkfB family radical SAM enzyme
MFDFTNFHIGLTNRCRLQCPECARTHRDGKFIHSMFDLDIEEFKRFLLSCDPKFILFCGNWGDPIYARDFVGLIKSLREKFEELQIVINTNGSGKRKEWWEKLMSVLGDRDCLVFSIDGTPGNYKKYRINSEWNSVELAIKTVVQYKKEHNKKTSIEWKHLVFSYNENTLDQSYELSKKLGFDKFYLQQSLVDDREGAKNTWLKISRPFRQIEDEFHDRKNKSLL